jgi:cell division transport system permease protein
MAAEEARKSMGIESSALFEENIFPSSVEVALKPEYVDPAKIMKLEQEAFQKIQTLAPVKRATYISREMAAEEARKSMGIESSALFEENIFPSSVEVALKPEYVDPAKINEAITQIKSTKGITDVKNNSTLMVEVYNNLNNILKWILGFSVLFLILAVVLINNSIRLKIFSKRFIIKTMQLVGAKRRFILKPFIKEAIILGVIGAVLGLAVLFGAWYYFITQIGTPFAQDNNQLIILVVCIFFGGILITVLSTIFATWRFLRSNVDDLYYS